MLRLILIFPNRSISLRRSRALQSSLHRTGKYVKMDPPLLQQHRSSVQNISYSIIRPFSYTRSKSLPNITITKVDKSNSGKNLHIYKHLSSSACVSSTGSAPKKHPRPKILKKTWDKVKTIIHPTSSSSSRRGSLRKSDNLSFRRVYSSAPSTPVQKFVFEFDNDGRNQIVEHEKEDRENSPEDNEKIQRNYAQLQKRLSEELHQRMSEYKPEKHLADNLSQDFKKRLQQWEMWKVSTGKVTYTEEELQNILPEEFSKKLHEWECIKTGSHPTCDSAASIITTASSNTSSDTKKSRKKKNSDSARQKELAWLEKQLEKIETEKKRLERELKKYSEREARLEKMKEALKNNPSDVWIRTPTANCKVDKITEKFTKKLYEWEERQGIQPESSTMALLCPQYYGPPPEQENSVEDADISITLRSDDQIESQGAAACGQTSSVSSSDYEEATDSFATHDKGNSGASNTDSDFYRAEPNSSRRRSSDAISTPLSARSPSLSAFTSDDEGDPCGLLKTVAEKEEENENLVKDAGSQTEVILRAKPIVVEDSEDNGECDNAGVFVATKRTIFTPIVDERETETIIIEPELKSPLLVRSLLQQQEMKSKQQEEQVWTKLNENQPKGLTKPIPPKIVGAIPKSQEGMRSFPKMGKIPVWCSPLGARRQFLTTAKPEPDFSLDKFLQETNILSGGEGGGSRIPVASSSGGLSRKYTIGGGYLPPAGYRSKLLTRSNSFGIRLDSRVREDQVALTKREVEEEPGNDVPLNLTSDSDSSCYNVTVTKSKSTGSIKSFSRAFAHKLGFGLAGKGNTPGSHKASNLPSSSFVAASTSSTCSASSSKPFSGWLPKK